MASQVINPKIFKSKNTMLNKRIQTGRKNKRRMIRKRTQKMLKKIQLKNRGPFQVHKIKIQSSPLSDLATLIVTPNK